MQANLENDGQDQTGEGMMEEDPRQAIFSRRSLTRLFGAAGAAALAGCASRATAGETTGTISAADTLAGGLPSMAALRALAATAGTSFAVVQGYYQPDDGGGGLFYWNPDSTETDDGGTVIASTGASVGRWKRVLVQPRVLELAWFGATPGTNAGLTNRTALTSALQVIHAWGGGTLHVSRLYPLGDPSDSSWLGIGVGMSAADGGLVPAIDGLSIVGTTAGAGFQFMRPTSAHTMAGLKLSGCKRLVLRGLTFDGNSQGIELVYLLRCASARICACTFQNALTSFSIEMVGGTDNRVEGNQFGAGGGLKIGYVATAGDHEEGAHVVGNRFVGTGEMPGNRRAAIYAAIRNGMISHNSFENAAAGITLLSDHLDTEVCDSVAIVGNTFMDCDFGVRSDPTSSGGPPAPTRNISVIGNVIERAGGAGSSWAPGIGIYISNDLTVAGNVLKDCDSAYALLLLSVTGGVISGNVVDLTVPTTQVLPQQPWGIFFSIQTSETRDLLLTGNLVGGYAAGIGGGTHGATCSNISLSGNTVTRLTGSQPLGFRIDASTPGASLIGNRVDPGGTFDYVLMSDCRMAGNAGKVTTFNGSTYFAEDQGRHTLAPSTSPPASAPAGTAFAAGDIVYHAAPVTGGNLGWVWTGAAGWKPFGTIG
jgi:hypothetical protein